MPASQIFLWSCLVFLVGVGFSSFLQISLFLFSFFGACGALFSITGKLLGKPRVAFFGIMLAIFIFGMWRFEAAWQQSFDSDLAKLNQGNGEVQLTGKIIRDPVLNQNSQQVIIQPEGLKGKILVISGRYPQYRYGDVIEFSSKLQAPSNLNGFDYRNYLAKDGIYSQAVFPEISLVSQNQGNPAYAGLIWIKHKLQEGVLSSLPSPHDHLLSAILFGDQSGIEGCSAKEKESDPGCAKLKEELNISGLRHLSAVSGTHVSIMAGVLMAFFVGLGLWRQQAFWLTIAFIWSFILMIGLPASAVRAGIMGTLMLAAQRIGRPVSMGRVITIAAAFMVLQNPMILSFDIGFQLSFLAVIGMAYLQKPIEYRLKFIPKAIKPVMATALAAQIFTLPLLVYNFGYISLYSLVANILAEPVVYFITVYGFILAGASSISNLLGWLLFFPMWLALSYLLAIVGFFSKLPYASLSFGINFIWLSAAYALMGIFIWHLQVRDKYRFLGPGI